MLHFSHVNAIFQSFFLKFYTEFIYVQKYLTGEQVIRTAGRFCRTGDEAVRTDANFFERMTQVVRTNANFFQTAFKRVLNGIPFENGKPLKHVFAWKVTFSFHHLSIACRNLLCNW